MVYMEKNLKKEWIYSLWASLVAQMIKNLPAMWETLGSIPKSGRFPGEGDGYPLQYSCLENPMDRGAWRSIVHEVVKSQTIPWTEDPGRLQTMGS